MRSSFVSISTLLLLMTSSLVILALSRQKSHEFQDSNSNSVKVAKRQVRHGHEEEIPTVAVNSELSLSSSWNKNANGMPIKYLQQEDCSPPKSSGEKQEVQRMRKRSANYRESNSSNDLNTPAISSTTSTNVTAEKDQEKFANPPQDKLQPKIDITKISNYDKFLNDFEYENENANKSDIPISVCRQHGYLPKRLFALNSCAHCYNYVRDTPGLFGNPSKKWNMTDIEWIVPGNEKNFTISVLVSPALNLTVFANVSGPESALLSSFANEDARRKWLDCCHAAEKCCERIQTSYTTISASSSQDERFCVPTWDGWQCWNQTKSGTPAHEPCPHYIYFAMTEAPACTGFAEKVCESSGKWRSKTNTRTLEIKERTNYANCGSAVIDALKRRTYVHVLAYAFSIIAIIPALIVFVAYKQLRVDRIILHRNLFASMLVNGLVVIAFKTIVMLSELKNDSSPDSIINQNGVGCRLLFILTKYSRMTNYMWMFCEGYYLHKLIAAAFAEQKSLIIFYLIGWAFPVIPTLAYAIIRMSDDELNDRCWVIPEESIEWIFNGPSLLSLLINMLFLINIIRVLVTKLRAAHANEPSQYRKAVRATLVLLPLFGLHFVVTIYRPASSAGTCEWLAIYNHINDVLDGLQGFLVALIFCYLNGEVVNLVKRTYGRWREQNFGGGCNRQSSNSRLRSRQSRGGSMMGRSVVSTQCYSSVPASPETCNATRLTIITPATAPVVSSPNSNGGVESINMNNANIDNTSSTPTELNGKNKQKAVVALNGVGVGLTRTSLTITPATPNHLNSIVKIKNNDNTTWTEVQLNDLSSPDTAPTTSMEMKPQKNVRLSPTVTVNTNGVKGEHQL